MSSRTFVALRGTAAIVIALVGTQAGWTQSSPTRPVGTAPPVRPTAGPAQAQTGRPGVAPAESAPPGSGSAAANPAGNARLTRPEAEPLRMLDPKLENLLRAWEQNSSRIVTLQGKHQRSEFNSTFAVEKRSEGKFFYAAPDKGRMDLEGIDVPANAVSSRKDPKGVPYKLEPGRAEKWICTGKEVVMINDAAKEFEVAPLPPELQGERIIDGPLPFLFGLKAAEAKRRFDLAITKEVPEHHLVYVRAIPRQPADAQNFQSADIVLDTTRFVPTAVRLIDPAGTIETRYLFDADSMKINDKNPLNGLAAMFKGETNPFQPKLTGYKRIQQPLATPGEIQPAGNQAPANGFPQQPSRAPQPASAPPRTNAPPR